MVARDVPLCDTKISEECTIVWHQNKWGMYHCVTPRSARELARSVLGHKQALATPLVQQVPVHTLYKTYTHICFTYSDLIHVVHTHILYNAVTQGLRGLYHFVASRSARGLARSVLHQSRTCIHQCQRFDKVRESLRTLKLFEEFDVQFWETGPWAPSPTFKSLSNFDRTPNGTFQNR
jgi:hypothetical protein